MFFFTLKSLSTDPYFKEVGSCDFLKNLHTGYPKFKTKIRCIHDGSFDATTHLT